MDSAPLELGTESTSPLASTSVLPLSSALLAVPPRAIASTPNRAPHNRNGLGSAFFRDALVCPDDSCVLAFAEDRSLSLYHVNTDIAKREWSPEWIYRPSDALLSFQWFPGATSSNPAMFAFAVGVKDHPIHLLDGGDRRVRASYPIVDHRERFVAPHSMVFAPDGSKIYGGFENAIEVLEVSRPGMDGSRLHTTPTRGSRTGQKGIISTLAFRPDFSGLLAAGSFSGTIGLYDPNVGKNGNILGVLKCEDPGGVTKLAFHPGANLLYAASRHSAGIEVWDLRSLETSLGTIRRPANTNQRLGFDVDPTGTWLAAGDDRGTVSIWSAMIEDGGRAEPITSFNLGPKSVGSVSFTSGGSQLLTCYGSRDFRSDEVFGSSEDEAEDESSAEASLHLWTWGE